MKRNKHQIEWEIRHNNTPGYHTFLICPECNYNMHRGKTRACNICLKKELKQITL